MANYFVVGGDGKEYGPVTQTDVRQWIAEGRLSAESRVKAESDAEFRALGQFPEFAPDLSAKRTAPAPAPAAFATADPLDGRDEALQLVKAPAIALQVVGGLNVVMSLWGLAQHLFLFKSVDEEIAKYPQLQDPNTPKWVVQWLTLVYGPLGIASSIFALLMGALIFWGAYKMQRLQGFTFAMVAAIIAMLPCFSPCFCIGLPFGIWALIVLNKPAVKSKFE